MKGQSAAGRAPVKLKKGLAAFAGGFGGSPPPGSKIAMLPRKFAKGLDLRGGVPKYKTKGLAQQIHFLDFLTPDFLDELEELDETPEEQYDLLETACVNFISGLPDAPGTLYSIMMASGEYSGGSTFSADKIGPKLADLLFRFARSKSVQQLSDYAAAVLTTTPRK
jgi:hypothetical protein